MPTFDEVMNAAAAADAQGNHEDAKQLLTIAKGLQGQGQQPTAEPQQPQQQQTVRNPFTDPEPTPAAQPKLSPKDTVEKALGSKDVLEKMKNSTNQNPAVADAGVTGGALGAMSPELVGGAGRALMAVPTPWTEVAGAALMAAAPLMRSARVVDTAVGALSGASAEGAKGVAKALGASPMVAEGVGLAAGTVAGLPKEIANGIGAFAHGGVNLVRKLVGSEVSESAAIRAARDGIAKPGVSSQPQTDFHAALAQSVESDLKASRLHADKIEADARAHADQLAQTDSAAAQRIVSDAKQRADSIRNAARTRADALDKATNGKLKTAAAVQKQQDAELAKVGTPREASDIGNDIRRTVTDRQGAEIEARKTAYQNLQNQRDAIVAQKEGQGQMIGQMPEMKQLQKDIDVLTLDTKVGQKAAGGKALVTDQAQLRDLRGVREAISNRRVQSGVDENGNPTYTTFKTTFQALDDIRRRIGQQLAGEAKEGYAAISQQKAQEIYARLSDIQNKYVGGDIQKQMQSGYAEATGDLAKYRVGGGKKVTAVDRLDPQTFVRDPATLPGQFFKSQQSYRDLKELMGNDGQVRQLASDYVARSLLGKDSKQAAAWLKQNNDWIREEPGLAMQADSYVKKAAQIERLGDKFASRTNAYQREKQTTLDTAAKESTREVEEGTKRASQAAEGSLQTQERVRKAGAENAAAVRKAAEEKADAVMKQGFPAESTRKLLTTGSKEEVEYAIKAVAGTPGGKKAIEGAVRGVLRDTNPRNVQQLWEERVMPMLQYGNVLPAPVFKKLQSDVAKLVAATNGKPQPGLFAKLVRNAMVSEGAMAVTGIRHGERDDE